jgi:hypothetical protein
MWASLPIQATIATCKDETIATPPAGDPLAAAAPLCLTGYPLLMMSSSSTTSSSAKVLGMMVETTKRARSQVLFASADTVGRPPEKVDALRLPPGPLGTGVAILEPKNALPDLLLLLSLR